MQIVWRIHSCTTAQKRAAQKCDILQLNKAALFLTQLYKNITYIVLTQILPSVDALANVWGILQTFGISTLKSKDFQRRNLIPWESILFDFRPISLPICLCSFAKHL